MSVSQKRIEFGDFQTPPELAREVCALIKQSGFQPASIIEPTCGTGTFVRASREFFSGASRLVGFDCNPHYVSAARSALESTGDHSHADIREGNFFEVDWQHELRDLPQPLLVIGNPPWVTNATLGSLNSKNVPRKANVDNLRGMEALTGKSNFDISESMLRKSLEWLNGRTGMLAVLCKTAVARKVLNFAWNQAMQVHSASLYRIDAKKHFNASVDACLLMIETGPGSAARECRQFASLESGESESEFGVRNGTLVADVNLFDKWRCLWSGGSLAWRSGIKHDCAKVFELARFADHGFINGFNEKVELEDEVVFPLLKSSDVASHREPRKWIFVPQRLMSDSPNRLQITAPCAWSYLESHSEIIQRRRSSIYRNRPPYSIFGIGDYSFASWKVAISGLYKKLEFARVEPFFSKPVMLDDTCYLFPCDTQQESEQLLLLLTSAAAREFLSAMIFWDVKRPITAKLLNSLDLGALARTLGLNGAAVTALVERQRTKRVRHERQRSLF